MLIKDILRYSGSMKNETGRPAYDDDWYRAKLEQMRPLLELGHTIGYCAYQTGNWEYKTSLYEKYKLKDWFSEKLDLYRTLPGELINNTVIRLSTVINDKILQKLPLDRNDIEIIKLVAEKHRSAQPFFVTKVETSEANPDDVGKILDKIENDYGELGREAQKQVVANDASVQDKGQTGKDSHVQSEPAATATSH